MLSLWARADCLKAKRKLKADIISTFWFINVCETKSNQSFFFNNQKSSLVTCSNIIKLIKCPIVILSHPHPSEQLYLCDCANIPLLPSILSSPDNCPRKRIENNLLYCNFDSLVDATKEERKKENQILLWSYVENVQSGNLNLIENCVFF